MVAGADQNFTLLGAAFIARSPALQFVRGPRALGVVREGLAGECHRRASSAYFFALSIELNRGSPKLALRIDVLSHSHCRQATVADLAGVDHLHVVPAPPALSLRGPQ